MDARYRTEFQGAPVTPGERLKLTRKQRRVSVPALAEKIGVAPSTVRAHESGQNKIQTEMAEAYASALHIQPEYILYGTRRDPEPVPGVRLIPVLGDVQAGAWKEIPYEQIEPTEFLPWADPAYQRAENVFVLNVVGPSMNEHYPDGSQVVVVSAAEAGVREGDHVVVRRTRGGLIETTLKEVVLNEGRVELWPRSTDPKFQEPFIIERARDADEGPEIIAVVVGDYRRRPPRTGLPIL